MPPPTTAGLDRLITRLAGWAVGIFHQVECEGGPIPGGPVLVTANHPNSLLDPLIIFRVAGRTTRPLAKAPLFEQAMMGTVLRALGGLPVYRRQDDPAVMHRNEDTFSAAIAALQNGDAIQIYPEGRSHSEPALAPMKTGAARIALAAENASDWNLGLRIVPIGITYRRKALFRGRALAVVGQPFAVDTWRQQFLSDEQEAVRGLTDQITRGIEAVTLNLTDHDDLDLIETADRLYTREKGERGWREREGLADRMPRLRFFAHALAWLRAAEPERHRHLEHSVRRYQRAVKLFGATEGDLPPVYKPADVRRYVVREAGALIVGLPFALAGGAIWLPAYQAPRAAVALIKPEFEAIATYKLATSFFMVPLTIAVVAGLAWRIAGPWAAGLAAIATPLLGFAVIGWRERWDRVSEDARVFFRVVRHRRGVDRIASLRSALVAEFDAILDRVPLPVDQTEE